MADFRHRLAGFRQKGVTVLRPIFDSGCDLQPAGVFLHCARNAVADDVPIRFDDLNFDARDRRGLDADTAIRRLYVLHSGTLTSGVLVFWALMPRYRWSPQVVAMPGIREVALAVYDPIIAPAICR